MNHYITKDYARAFYRFCRDLAENLKIVPDRMDGIFLAPMKPLLGDGATNNSTLQEMECCLLAVRNIGKCVTEAVYVRDTAFKMPVEVMLELQQNRHPVESGFQRLLDGFRERLDLQPNICYKMTGVGEKDSPRLLAKEVLITCCDCLGRRFDFPERLFPLEMVTPDAVWKDRRFSLVGTPYYAPDTQTDDVYCLLFADPDNRFDNHAIKVLRYLPVPFGQLSDSSNVFFELGYVARSDNFELHEYMMNKSRLLWGHVDDGSIRILGGCEQFLCGGQLERYLLPAFIAKQIN